MAKDKKLEITQVFDSPIEKVWDAWTNPQSMMQWKAPEGLSTPSVETDLKVGGKYRIVMENSQMKIAVGGEYLEIVKPHKLVYTWLWEGSPKETHTTTVTILLQEREKNKTQVTLIHTGFVDEQMAKEHKEGWESTLKKLAKFLK